MERTDRQDMLLYEALGDLLTRVRGKIGLKALAEVYAEKPATSASDARERYIMLRQVGDERFVTVIGYICCVGERVWYEDAMGDQL